MKGDHTCLCVGILIGVAIVGVLCGVFVIKSKGEEVTELKQIHIVFSHGERTPTDDELEVYPLGRHDSGNYYPYGLGALTNEGKMTAFRLGEALRQRYDEFLTRTYHHKDLIMQAADQDVSKMSALLLLAGLFPVQQREMWTNIHWQPIPYTNIEKQEDYLLYETNCNMYTREKERVTEVFSQNMLLPYKHLFERLSVYTGHNITRPSQALQLSTLLDAQKDMDLGYPKWYEKIKKSLKDIVKLEYNIMLHNKLLQKLSSGALLQKILEDSKKKVKEELELSHRPKTYLYSGGRKNLAAILAATGLVKAHEPEHGAAFIVELHRMQPAGDYAFKAYYLDNESEDAKLLVLPGCEVLCPVEEFETLLSDVLVQDYVAECQVE